MRFRDSGILIVDHCEDLLQRHFRVFYAIHTRQLGPMHWVLHVGAMAWATWAVIWTFAKEDPGGAASLDDLSGEAQGCSDAACNLTEEARHDE
jgi:hypothetical protein